MKFPWLALNWYGWKLSELGALTAWVHATLSMRVAVLKILGCLPWNCGLPVALSRVRNWSFFLGFLGKAITKWHRWSLFIDEVDPPACHSFPWLLLSWDICTEAVPTRSPTFPLTTPPLCLLHHCHLRTSSINTEVAAWPRIVIPLWDILSWTVLSNINTLIGMHLGLPCFSLSCLRVRLGIAFENKFCSSLSVFSDTKNSFELVKVPHHPKWSASCSHPLTVWPSCWSVWES